MISPKKLIKIARNNQKRITFPITAGCVHQGCNTAAAVDKGHFVVYANDGRRFVIPLFYLHSNIFKELLQMAEEDYGLPRDGPITLPCDAVLMEYAVSLLQRNAAKDLERALLMSITNGHCLSSSWIQQGQINQQWLISGF